MATRAYWRQQYALWEKSGLTQRVFCTVRGLSYKSFCTWKGELKRLDAAGPNARWGSYPSLRDIAEVQKLQSSAYGDVGRRSRPTAIVIDRITPGVEVELPDGTRIRFDRSVSADRIKRIVSALEGRLPKASS